MGYDCHDPVVDNETVEFRPALQAVDAQGNVFWDNREDKKPFTIELDPLSYSEYEALNDELLMTITSENPNSNAQAKARKQIKQMIIERAGKVKNWKSRSVRTKGKVYTAHTPEELIAALEDGPHAVGATVLGSVLLALSNHTQLAAGVWAESKKSSG